MEEELALFKKAFLVMNPDIPDEAWDHVVQHCSFQTVPRKEYLLEAGTPQPGIQFLTEGLVRGYYLNGKGEEMTFYFINHHGWVTDYAALLEQQPSLYYFQALESSKFITLSYEGMQSGYATYASLQKFGRLIAEHILIGQQRRIESFQFHTAEERYLAFMEEHPALYNRISLTHLSSYLGIQRQSLTRIRQKLSHL